VAHGIEDGDAGGVGVDAVVERVAPEVVGRRQGTADHRPVAAEGQGRQQLPGQLGGDRHRRPSAVALEEVAVVRLGHDQLGGLRGEVHVRIEEGVGHRAGQLVADDAEPLVALHHRHPQQRSVAVPLEVQSAERPAGQGPFDGHRLPGRPAGPGERGQDPLLVVDQEDRGVEDAEPAGVVGQEARHVVGYGELGVGEEVADRFGGRAGRHTPHCVGRTAVPVGLNAD